MSGIVRALRESFVPLLGVLVGLIVLVAWLDGKAADLARRETVIRLEPALASWDPSRLTENGIVESAAGAALEPSDRPEIVAEREAARRGDLEGAGKLLADALAKAPEDAQLLAESGVIALRRGDLDAAARFLDQALAKNPGDYSASFNRGLVAQRAGQVDLARDHYRRALERRASSFDARFNLGLLELGAGRLEDAAAAFEQAASSGANANRARALFSLGVTQARMGQDDKALATYDKAIEYQPTYLLPRYNQAVIHASRPDAASKEKAARLVAALVALAPDFAPAWFLQGRMASTAGDKEAALAAYEKAAAFDPTFFKARYNAALVALDMDRVDQAKERFERLTVEFPERAEPWFNLGRILHGKDDHVGAIAMYQKAIALRPEGYPEAQLDLAVSQRAAGQGEAALATLEALVERQPKMASAWLNRALVLVKLKRPDDARASLRQAIAVRPDYASAWYNLGKLESGEKRPEAAIEAYRKALEAEPTMFKAALNLGVELADLDRWEDAIAAYRSALTLVPDHAPAHFNLGLALRALGRNEEAEAEYARVIELDPDNVAARQNLGVLLGRRGRHEQAVEVYREALEVEPGKIALRVNLAQELRLLDRAAEARTELERARRIDAKHRGAIVVLAAMEVDEDRLGAATALLDPLIASGKASGETHAILARVRLARGDVAGAQESVAAALAGEPEDATVLAIAARVALRAGDRTRAEAHFKAAVAANAEDIEVRRLAAEADWEVR